YQRQFLLRVASENPWLNVAGGARQTGGNWSTNVAPGATVDALFNLGSTYTINLAGAGSARVVAAQSGNVTLDLGGNTLAVGAVVVGRDAGDNAHLTTNGSGTLMIGGAFTVAANAGATGAY